MILSVKKALQTTKTYQNAENHRPVAEKAGNMKLPGWLFSCVSVHFLSCFTATLLSAVIAGFGIRTDVIS